jgi:glutamine phosphoribosylpyrophosphate amidotransferase
LTTYFFGGGGKAATALRFQLEDALKTIITWEQKTKIRKKKDHGLAREVVSQKKMQKKMKKWTAGRVVRTGREGRRKDRVSSSARPKVPR